MKTKSAILQMYYGRRGGNDQIDIDGDYYKHNQKMGEAYEKLREKIQPLQELWELFIKFNECANEVNADEVEASYLEGFKFGLLIGVEAGESQCD